jgi:hypothetical protein
MPVQRQIPIQQAPIRQAPVQQERPQQATVQQDRPGNSPAPTTWQTPPIASVVNPRPTLARFVLPSPEALGVSVSLTGAQPAPATQVDWNAVQARMERTGVLRYKKEALPGGVRVTLTLRTSDPGLGQPVVAQATSEPAAIAMALDAAEAWAQKR